MLSTSAGIPTAIVLALVALRFEWSETDFDPDVNGVHTVPRKVMLGALLLSKLQMVPTQVYAAVAVAAFITLLVVLVKNGANKIDVAKFAAVGAVLGLRLATRQVAEATAFFAAGPGTINPLIFNLIGGVAFVAFAAYFARLDQHRSIQALVKVGFFDSYMCLAKFVIVMALFGLRLAMREPAAESSFFMPSPKAVSLMPHIDNFCAAIGINTFMLANIIGGLAFVAFATVVCRLHEHRSVKAICSMAPIDLAKLAVIVTLLGARLATRGAQTDSEGFFNQNPSKEINSAYLLNGAGALMFVGFATSVGRLTEWHPALHAKKPPAKASAK